MQEDPDDVTDVCGCKNFTDNINPDSLKVLNSCKVERSLAEAKAGDSFQFLRQGYFCVDPDSSGDALVFNRTVPLRDTWARMDRSRQ